MQAQQPADYWRTVMGQKIAFTGDPGSGEPMTGHPALRAALGGKTAQTTGVTSETWAKQVAERAKKYHGDMDAVAKEAKKAFPSTIGGLHVQLDAHPAEAMFEGDKEPPPSVEIFGTLKKSGKEVGDFQRTIMPKSDGRMVAYHEHLELVPEARGQGFSKELAARQDALYEKIGVSEIHLTANLEQGGYVWARHGYDFADRASRDHVLKMVASRMATVDHPQVFGTGAKREKAYEKHKARLIKEADTKGMHSWDIAHLEYKGKPVGKEGMMGTSWHGKKSLDPTSEGYKIGKAYIDGAGQKGKAK